MQLYNFFLLCSLLFLSFYSTSNKLKLISDYSHNESIFSKTRLFKHETKYYVVLCSSTRCEREWDSCRNNEFSQCTSKCSRYATMHLYIHEAYHEALCMLVNNTRFVSYKRYENSGFIDDFCLFLFFQFLLF